MSALLANGPLQYSFMQNAYLVGTIVSVLAAIVGFFVVTRGLSFAAHALSHVGFAGAAGAVLIGVDPLVGLIVFCVGAALTMGILGERLRGRDVAIGVMSPLSRSALAPCSSSCTPATQPRCSRSCSAPSSA